MLIIYFSCSQFSVLMGPTFVLLIRSVRIFKFTKRLVIFIINMRKFSDDFNFIYFLISGFNLQTLYLRFYACLILG